MRYETGEPSRYAYNATPYNVGAWLIWWISRRKCLAEIKFGSVASP